MEAAEAKLQRILEGTRQFVVPHFQRPYSWREKQWDVLWRDLVDLVEAPTAEPHFLGSIVSAPARSVPEGVEKRLLIDGQQRLSTVVLLLAVLRDAAQERGQLRLADQINDLVVNRHHDELDRYKLLPTQGDSSADSDREAFLAIVEGRDHTTTSGFGTAATYFRDRLRRADAPPLDALFRAATARLTLVSIILDDRDNPHRIFESLNGKGRPLSQADLIRNYFFMRLPAREHERVYRTRWQPMQARLGEDVLTEFVRHYLMQRGQVVNESDVYATLKARVDAPGVDVVAQLEALSTHSRYYHVLLDPSLEPTPAIRERLTRLRRLEVTVAFPFLLAVYADHATGKLDAPTLCAMLDVVETYVVRRFVCGVATSGLNKVFVPLYAQISGAAAPLEALRSTLAERSCPRDAQFRERLSSARLYGGGERRERCKLLLERLEGALGHKERVAMAELTIEHVLPQTPSDWWREHLGDEWAEDHQTLVHTLGNLTLTGYNSELSNDTYPDKRRLLRQSHVALNRYFDDVETWRAEDIETRADALADIALTVWPFFGPLEADEAAVPTEDTADVTSTLPLSMSFRGTQYPVRAWAEVLVLTLDAIYRDAPDEFARVEEALSRMIRRDPSTFRSARRLRPLASGAFVETNQSATSIHRACLQALEVVSIGPDEWAVERRSLLPRDEEPPAPSELKALDGEVWALVRARLAASGSFSRLPAARPQHWYAIATGRSGFALSLGISGVRSRAFVRLQVNVDDASEVIRALHADRAAIEREIGAPLEWELDADHRRRTATSMRPFDVRARETWPDAVEWFVRTALAFRAAFGPRIAAQEP